MKHLTVAIIIVIAGVFLIKKIKDDERKKREVLEIEIETLKGKYSEVWTTLNQLKQKHELELLKIEISTKEKFVKEMKDELLKMNQTSNPKVIRKEKEFIPVNF